MNARFTNRVVVVTGASTGIGLATTRRFLAEGARVVLAARHPEALERATAELKAPDRTLAVPCDVSNRADVENLLARADAHFGGIDVLVNNAAVGLTAPFAVIPTEDIRALFETNFYGTLYGCQAVLPYLKQRGGGHIVNVASLAGLRGIPNTSIYSAAKAGVIALSDAMRIECRADKINVTVICPSRVRREDTSFFDTAKRYGPVELYKVPSDLTADTVARALVNAVAKRKTLVVLPFHALLFYKLNLFFPRLVDRFLYKNMPRLPVSPSGSAPDRSSPSK